MSIAERPVDSPPHAARPGRGAPLVMIPGLSGHSRRGMRLERWIARHETVGLSGSRTVWRIPRRIGLAPGTTIRDLAADYADILRRSFDGPVDVVGISTGGSIALQLAADHPELVRRLVLVSAASRLSDAGRATQRQVAELLRAGRPRRAAALFLGTTGASTLSRSALALTGLLAPRLVVGHDDEDLLTTLDAEDDFDLTPRLDAMPTPTLVTGGARDRYYGELFEPTRTSMPDARLEVYPRAGHISPLGNRVLARQILRFLADPVA